MDSLTLFVKMLDIFVFLVKGLGIAMLAVTAGFLIKLLPKRIQNVVRIVAAALLFVVLLGENLLNMFIVSAIKQGILVLSALGIFVIFETVKILCALKRRVVLFTSLMADAPGKRAPSVERRNFKVGYFASYLRQTPLMLD